MLVESLAALACGGLTYIYLDGKETRKIKRNWTETLENFKGEGVKLSKKINGKTVYITFKLNKIFPRAYGWYGICNVPKGLAYSGLESAVKVLEDSFGARITLERKVIDGKCAYVAVQCIIKDMCKVDFKPFKTEHFELGLGIELDGSHYKMDLNKDTHLLIIGANGTGKSYLLATILTNLFYYNKKNFEIWGIQNKKNDLDVFSKLFKFQANNIEESLNMLERIEKMANLRNKEFSENKCRDITQFNELFPKQAKKRVLVVVEEIFFMMAQQYDSEELQDLKKKCLAYFMSIVKAGRSSGIHFIATTQRATIQNLPSDVKQECSKIALHMNSESNSENAIDIPDAKYLKPREFIFDGKAEVTTLVCPLVDKNFEILNRYVPEIQVPDLKNLKYKKTTYIIQPEKKYTAEKSEQLTLEDYYKKTGFLPDSIKKRLGLEEDTPSAEQPTETVKAPRRRGRPTKNQKEVAVDVNK